jgi:hypothetical protein
MIGLRIIVEEGGKMSDYTEMWKNLGLNLENHAGLLGVLTEGYKNIYLSQKGVEAYKVEKAIGTIPFMRLGTDYSMGDFGQLKTRVEAFLEMLQ